MASKKFILTLLCITAMTLVVVGCGSDDDSPVAPVVDTAPPALPSGADVQYSAVTQSVSLSWDQNVSDNDFDGFLISRGSYGLDPEPLVTQPQAVNSYVDSDLVGAGRRATYYIYSVDTVGNVSAAATVSVNLAPIEESGPRIRME